MGNVFFVLLMVAALVLAFIGGRRSVSKPVPMPKPCFGLSEAESVKAALGGLTPDQAQVAKVAAAVGRMDITLEKDISNARKNLAGVKMGAERAIFEHEKRIAREKAIITSVTARDNEIADLAAAFG